MPRSGREAKLKVAIRLQEVGQAHPGQLAGTRRSIGCVWLEVTQRCNLDCSACYLPDYAELVPDVPLSVLMKRIGLIHQHYGPGCDIQISGGDSTLRPIEDLLAVVTQIKRLNMRSSLFTNGIKAARRVHRKGRGTRT